MSWVDRRRRSWMQGFSSSRAGRVTWRGGMRWKNGTFWDIFRIFFGCFCELCRIRDRGRSPVSSPPNYIPTPLSLKIASLSHVAAIDQAVAAGSAKTKRFCSMGNKLFTPARQQGIGYCRGSVVNGAAVAGETGTPIQPMGEKGTLIVVSVPTMPSTVGG